MSELRVTYTTVLRLDGFTVEIDDGNVYEIVDVRGLIHSELRRDPTGFWFVHRDVEHRTPHQNAEQALRAFHNAEAVLNTPLRVLITGSREFTERPIVAAALSQVARENPGRQLTVVHGAARGADSLAGAVARSAPNRLIEEAHPVTNWKLPDGSKNWRAGFDRNQTMVDLGADICLAFLKLEAKNNGTRHSMGAAGEAGIPVREHWSTV